MGAVCLLASDFRPDLTKLELNISIEGILIILYVLMIKLKINYLNLFCHYLNRLRRN